MIGVPLTVRFFVAAGTAAAVVGCSSGSDSPDSAGDSAKPEASPTSAAASPTQDNGKQTYLDSVNALCDALLPKVIEATHGGSIDVPAKEWVETWPAHKALLDGFDADLAQVPVPSSAKETAQVMADYVVWAAGIDERRIAAARKGEAAWRHEVAAEKEITDDPTLLELATAGFADSCQAR